MHVHIHMYICIFPLHLHHMVQFTFHVLLHVYLQILKRTFHVLYKINYHCFSVMGFYEDGEPFFTTSPLKAHSGCGHNAAVNFSHILLHIRVCVHFV